MNANFGLLDPLPGKAKKDRKKELLVERAQADFNAWLDESEVLGQKIHHRGTEGPATNQTHDIVKAGIRK
jgi:hypothetical protein